MTAPRTLVCVGGPMHEETYVVSPEAEEIRVPILRGSPRRYLSTGDGTLDFIEHIYRVGQLRGTKRLYLYYTGARISS